MYTFFDNVPLHFIPLVLVVLLLISVEIGYRMGRWIKIRNINAKEAPLGTNVAAILSLLAFMLAFTFGLAGSRFESRKNVILEESNAIGTAYLRSEYLLEPHRSEIKNILSQYVDLRIEATKDLKLDYVLARSSQLQDMLWSHVVKIAKSNPTSVVDALFIESINQIIDIHSKREMVVLWSRIPLVIWVVLFLLSFFSMGSLGYQAGIENQRSNLMNFILILAFTSVIYLIADLDRPQEGKLNISQTLMIEVQSKIKKSA